MHSAYNFVLIPINVCSMGNSCGKDPLVYFIAFLDCMKCVLLVKQLLITVSLSE